jgi:hypothetical protein
MEVECSFCGHMMHVPPDWIGKDLKCLACNRTFRAAAKGVLITQDSSPEESEPRPIWAKLSRRVGELFSPGSS